MKQEIFDSLLSTRPENDFSSSEDFVKDGLLDSLDVVVLVSELELKFGIKIPGEDIIAENFSSVDAIEKLLATLKAP